MILTPTSRIDHYVREGWWGKRRIHDWVQDNLHDRADQVALVDPPNRSGIVGGTPRRMTWRELSAEVDRLSDCLLANGLQRDDIALVQLPNCVELPLVYLACMQVGIIFTPVPVQYRENELRHIAALTSPRAAITAGIIHRHDHKAMLTALASCQPEPMRVLTLDELASHRPVELSSLTHARQAQVPLADDVVSICWTSGTEAQPKGVPRSHNEWIGFAETIVISGRLDRGAALLNSFPLVNMAGIAGQFLPWLMVGGKLVLHHPLDVDLVLRQIVEEDIAYTVASPATLARMAADPHTMSRIAQSKLRALGSASGALPEWVAEAFEVERNIRIVNYYGTNEGCSLTSCSDDIPDVLVRTKHFPRFGVRGLTWSLPVARRIETRLVDPTSGAIIDTPGQAGELRARGPSIFSGYYKAPGMTARAFDEDGFYRSGDLFEIAGDRGQYYRFVGRLKDIIVRGGFNISSEELESLLSEHQKIAEVAVVGYPDAILGERVCAVVVPKPGASVALEELAGFLVEEKRIARFKAPERLLVVSALPRNPVGKVIKRELRAELMAPEAS